MNTFININTHVCIFIHMYDIVIVSMHIYIERRSRKIDLSIGDNKGVNASLGGFSKASYVSGVFMHKILYTHHANLICDSILIFLNIFSILIPVLTMNTHICIYIYIIIQIHTYS
jgi:hypothetical protein